MGPQLDPVVGIPLIAGLMLAFWFAIALITYNRRDLQPLKSSGQWMIQFTGLSLMVLSICLTEILFYSHALSNYKDFDFCDFYEYLASFFYGGCIFPYYLRAYRLSFLYYRTKEFIVYQNRMSGFRNHSSKIKKSKKSKKSTKHKKNLKKNNNDKSIKIKNKTDKNNSNDNNNINSNSNKNSKNSKNSKNRANSKNSKSKNANKMVRIRNAFGSQYYEFRRNHQGSKYWMEESSILILLCIVTFIIFFFRLLLNFVTNHEYKWHLISLSCDRNTNNLDAATLVWILIHSGESFALLWFIIKLRPIHKDFSIRRELRFVTFFWLFSTFISLLLYFYTISPPLRNSLKSIFNGMKNSSNTHSGDIFSHNDFIWQLNSICELLRFVPCFIITFIYPLYLTFSYQTKSMPLFSNCRILYDLKLLLSDLNGVKYFREYLRRSNKIELVLFWIEIEIYKDYCETHATQRINRKFISSFQVYRQATRIFDKYLKYNCEYPINHNIIPFYTKHEIATQLNLVEKLYQPGKYNNSNNNNNNNKGVRGSKDQRDNNNNNNISNVNSLNNRRYSHQDSDEKHNHSNQSENGLYLARNSINNSFSYSTDSTAIERHNHLALSKPSLSERFQSVTSSIKFGPSNYTSSKNVETLSTVYQEAQEQVYIALKQCFPSFLASDICEALLNKLRTEERFLDALHKSRML